MTISLLIAALTVAFPREGAKLPFVERCYLIGSVPPGITNVMVQGRPATVHSLGGWVAMADLTVGSNSVSLTSVDRSFSSTQEVKRVLYVAPKPSVSSSIASAVKKYNKLDFAGDEPKPHPINSKSVMPVAVIDPGHGGPSDMGAISPHSLPEKDANLRLSKIVAKELEKRGWRVVLTRTNDVAISLFDRPKVAHRENADVFVSIHHNAPPFDKDPREFRYHCVYAWNDIGKSVATRVNAKMAAALAEKVKNNGVLHANYAVTRNPEIPSCLIEIDFITVPEGELDSWNRQRQEILSVAIADGLDEWRRNP